MEPLQPITRWDVLARAELRAMRAAIQDAYSWINPGVGFDPNPAMARRYDELMAAYRRAANAALYEAGLPPYEAGDAEHPGYSPTEEAQ